MKRSFCIVFALLLSIGIFCVAVNAEENAGGADRIYTLFDMNGSFISENPIDTSGVANKPWLLVGKDVFMTDNGGYPAPFDNTYEKSSFYYLAGSNSIEWLVSDENYTDYLSDDFVVEYTVDYSEEALGAFSIVFAYNYEYYIEVNIAHNGCGDIAIVTPSGRISVLSADSILNAKDPSGFISALSGEGNTLPEVFAVTLKVSIDENRMPREIQIYINGLEVGKTNAGFAESVTNLTPINNGSGAFPKDKLGNIVALKVSPGAKGVVNNIYIYSLGENTEPNYEAQAHYAEIYGNASFEAKTEENTVGPTESETVEKNLDREMNVIPGDTILTVVLILLGLVVLISVSVTVILFLRKRRI